MFTSLLRYTLIKSVKIFQLFLKPPRFPQRKSAKRLGEMSAPHHSAPARGAFAEASGALNPTMRRAIELSFSKCSTKRLYGRLLPASDEPIWLTYGQVASRVRPIALIVDVLAADVVARAGCIVASRRRPFLAISGPNSLEWLLCDWASSGTFVPSVGEYKSMIDTPFTHQKTPALRAARRPISCSNAVLFVL